MKSYHHDNCSRIKELNRRTYEPDGVTPKLKKSPAVSNNPDAVASYIGETSYYGYDRSGNLLSDGNATYTYDGFGRTAEVKMANGNGQINRYDAEGLRAEMEENGQLVQFLFNKEREVIAEETGNNVIRYVRGLGIISSDSESARTYYHYVSDNQGSVRLILTDTVNDRRIRNYYCYDAFGESIISHEDVHNRFRFNGEQYDPVTSQYYLRARFYNPIIGRFTQEDTYYGDGLNLYEYCRNNPVLYRDPSGHGVILICPGMQNLYNGTDFVVSPGGVVYKIEDYVNMIDFDKHVTLYHYTTEKGIQGILNSEKLNPSIKTLTTKDARLGSGQYLTDIVPGSKTLGQTSRILFGTPWNIRKVSYYIEIDISELNVLKGRDGVYYIPNENILDLSNRIVSFGKTGE